MPFLSRSRMGRLAQPLLALGLLCGLVFAAGAPAFAVAATPVTVAAAGAARPMAEEEAGAGWAVDTVDGANGTDRQNFTYDVTDGSTVTDSMRVTNISADPLTLRIYAADAYTSQSGSIDILPSGEPSVDSGTWIVPAVDHITLAPGTSQDVAFTINVPERARPGDHPAAIVASLSDDTGTQVNVERRLGLRVDVRVAGELQPGLAITQQAADFHADANPFAAGTLHVTYTVENVGNARLAVLEDVRAHGLFGWGAAASIGNQLPELLPGSTLTVERDVPMGAVGPIDGTLTLLTAPVMSDATAPSPVEAEIHASAVPWVPLIIVIVLLLAAAALAFWWWRRRRNQQLLEFLDHHEQEHA